MGCICSSGNTKKNEYETAQKLTIQNPSVKPESIKHNAAMSVEDMIKAKAISISQGTFVSEKKYITFLKEYDILEFIGKGKYSF